MFQQQEHYLHRPQQQHILWHFLHNKRTTLNTHRLHPQLHSFCQLMQLRCTTFNGACTQLQHLGTLIRSSVTQMYLYHSNVSAAAYREHSIIATICHRGCHITCIFQFISLTQDWINGSVPKRYIFPYIYVLAVLFGSALDKRSSIGSIHLDLIHVPSIKEIIVIVISIEF